jgi:hypothetical protein
MAAITSPLVLPAVWNESRALSLSSASSSCRSWSNAGNAVRTHNGGPRLGASSKWNRKMKAIRASAGDGGEDGASSPSSSTGSDLAGGVL